MGTLGRRSFRAALLATGVVLAVGFGAGLVRLLPWLFAPEIPLDVALPFARALGAKSTETALLLGPPVGFALAAAIFVERGEARALEALGVSPADLSRSIAGHALAIALIGWIGGAAWGSSADIPGRFAGQLVQRGRASCARATSPKSASVPLVGVTWLCFPGQPPRVTGPLPRSNNRAWFSAADLVPSDDLTEVTLADLRLVTRKDAETPFRLDLRASNGVVRGLPTWGRSARIPYLLRGVLITATLSIASLVATFVVLRYSIVRRWAALAIAGLPAVLALVALQRLDSTGFSKLAYLAIPLVPAIALLLPPLVARVARPRAR